MRTMAALAFVAVLVIGCSDDDVPQASDSGGTTSSVTPSTPVGTPEEIDADVVAAYRRAWTAFVTAGDPPDPDSRFLRQAMVGRALESTRRQLTAYQLEGLALRGSFEPQDPQVTERRGVHAEIEDCNVDRTEAFRIETGEVVDPASGQRVATHADLVFTEGRWRVYALTQGSRDCTTAA
jgi:hypothetical protein